MSNQKSTLSNMNILRVFGISLVVLRHAFAPFTDSWSLSDLYEYNIGADFIGKYISTLSMPLFVFISGYTYSFLRNYLNKYETYSILLEKKTRRLLIPYVIFAPLYIYFFKDYANVSEFLLPLWTGSGHLWFLLMIFVLFLIFYPFEAYLKKNIITGFIIAIVCYLLVLPIHYLNLDPLAHVFKYFIFFYIGYLFKFKNKLVLKHIHKKTNLLVLVHLSLFSFYFYLLKQSDNIYYTSAVNQLLLILGIISVTFAYNIINTMLNNSFFNKILVKKSIKVINDNSYYVYIFHQPILILLYSTLFFQRLNIAIVIVLGFLISFILALCFGYIFISTKLGKKVIGS
jgi:fucose 4-O-acetylase-like acetyltransferase